MFSVTRATRLALHSTDDVQLFFQVESLKSAIEGAKNATHIWHFYKVSRPGLMRIYSALFSYVIVVIQFHFKTVNIGLENDDLEGC